MSNDLSVIDLSHHNTVTSWDDIVRSGIIGVIHKCTEGAGYLDNTYVSRMESALSVGLAWGAYHYLHHGGIAAQIDWFLLNCCLPEGSRVVIDYEDPSCDLNDLRSAVKSLWSRDPTLQVAIYGGSLLKEQLGNSKDDVLAETSLWLAQYTSGTPKWPTGTWPTWSLWQYSDGDVGGQPRTIAGTQPPIDCNVFNGTRDQCLKWFGPYEEPQPIPIPFPKEAVSIEITATEGVEIAVFVNGTAYSRGT
jgi:lysozyme